MLRKILKSKTGAGLEVILSSDGIDKVNYCLFENKKGSVKSVSIRSNELLSNINIPENTPVHLVLNGRGIIHKKIASGADNNNTLLGKVLPDSDPDDFYIQQAPASEGVFVSIIRKELLDQTLSELKELKISVCACSLGPFVLGEIGALINTKSEELNTPHFSLSFKEHRIETISSVQKTIDDEFIRIAEETVPAPAALAFAAGICGFLDSTNIVFPVSQVDNEKEEFFNQQLFKKAGWAALTFFLSVLLINYLVFDHYWKKQSKLKEEMSVNQESLQKFESIENEYKEKKAFFENTGFLEPSKTSFYADRLAADLPENIQLTGLEINPPLKKIHEDSLLTFNTKKIIIGGKCDQGTTLNDWIKQLKKRDWVEKVNISNYSQDKDEARGKFSLELIIK